MTPHRCSGSLLLLLSLLVASPVLAQQPVATKASEAGHVVVLVPLGKVRKELLDRVSQELQAKLLVQVRIDGQRELPKEAWYAPRRRWRAEKLLDALDAAPPEGAWKVVGVTEAEISTTKGDIQDWGIAGLGNLGGLSCVVSSHIYQKHSRSKEALLRRLGDLAVHEFGHTLGLDHCETRGCVMADAKGKAIKSADGSTGYLCAKCLGQLSPEVRALVKAPPPGKNADASAAPH